MSDQTPDPIRQLARFTTDDLVSAPLHPAQVRHLGDRRRTRRHAALVAASVVAVLAAVTPVALLAHRGDGSPTPGPLTSRPSPTASGTEPAVVTYPGNGVEVVTPSDADKLTGTSPAFRAFVVDQAQKAAEDGAACPGADHGITVQKYSAAGYALGAVNSCGGYVALWVETDGTWQEGMGTQDVWNCTTLDYLAVPRDFAGDCAAEAGSFGPQGTGTLQLGMSKAEIAAAGERVGTVYAGTACAAMYGPRPSAASNGIDGLVHQTFGLVQINAHPDDITPERISLGSTYAAAKAAYPALRREGDYWVVPLRGHAQYRMAFSGLGPQDTVTLLVLDSTKAACW